MAGPFKMKGSPMQRNFGIGSPAKDTMTTGDGSRYIKHSHDPDDPKKARESGGTTQNEADMHTGSRKPAPAKKVTDPKKLEKEIMIAKKTMTPKKFKEMQALMKKLQKEHKNKTIGKGLSKKGGIKDPRFGGGFKKYLSGTKPTKKP